MVEAFESTEGFKGEFVSLFQFLGEEVMIMFCLE
jgi:hypothetical protein